VAGGGERRNISERKQELVGAVKLASKTEDSVKGQMYNKAGARTHFPLGLVCTSFVTLSHTHTHTHTNTSTESDNISGNKRIFCSLDLQENTEPLKILRLQ
jgi:hypothetical protein